MTNKSLPRRKLFSAFFKPNGNNQNKDLLFEKYSRKTSGRKPYQSSNTDNNSAERIGNITSGLTPYSGLWTSVELIHLLKRTRFGYTKAEYDALSGMTMTAAVDTILNISPTVPSPPINYYNNLFADENNLPYGADWTNNAFASNTVGRTSNVYRYEGLKRWSLGLALNQDITIREKMACFWYHFIPIDFFAIYQSSNIYCSTNSARICYQYMKMFRDNAMGNFKTLIRNMATQPAMMFYLNNQANTKTAPDENFAREIMELFTLGKGSLSLYTQADVVAAAKVLTGWRVQNLNTIATTTAFDVTYHDTSNKQFSTFFNNTIINNNGATELDDFIDMIFSKSQVVSEYICRRLYRYFVYYDIDANIEANVITPLAQTFVANNWNIYPVIRQLLMSQHFYDVANKGVYIKSPFDLVIGSLKHFNINHNVSDPTNYQAQYQVWQYFNDTILANMEQAMGKVPNVSGWPAFYQNPSFHQYWINSNTIQKRFTFLQKIFDGFNLTYNGLTTNIKVDVISYVNQFPNNIIQNPNLLIDECLKYLLPVDLSAAKKISLKQQTLLYQQSTDAYWTSAWNSYVNAPTNTSNINLVTQRLKSLLYTIVQYAEYQLM